MDHGVNGLVMRRDGDLVARTKTVDVLTVGLDIPLDDVRRAQLRDDAQPDGSECRVRSSWH